MPKHAKTPWHIRTRPSYYRGNFDYDEGPFNRINRSADGMIDYDTMVVDEEDLEEIKKKDIDKKTKQKMKIEAVPEDEKYPDPDSPAPKNDIFEADENYYRKIYTTRNDEIEKNKTEDKRKLKIISAELNKKAIIRGKDLRACPFGLPIPSACQNAGKSVHRMAPAKEGDEDLAKANRLIYAYHKGCKECPYADKILDEHNKVDCDFEDTGAGQKSAPFRGSPLYPKTFHGIGLDGLYGYPLGFYADNNESRNLFFGLFSLLGFNTVDEIIKLADKYDKCNQNDKADILDGLLAKLSKIKEEYKDTFEKIERYLEKHREKYESERGDTGLLWELSDAWFGPRQVNR